MSRTSIVQQPGNEFFARARFSGDEYGRTRSRRFLNQSPQIPHGMTAADKAVLAHGGGQLGLQVSPLLEHLMVITKLADLVRQSRIDEHIDTITRHDDVEVAQLTLGAMQKAAFLDPDLIPQIIDRAKGTFFDQLRTIEQQLPD